MFTHPDTTHPTAPQAAQQEQLQADLAKCQEIRTEYERTIAACPRIIEITSMLLGDRKHLTRQEDITFCLEYQHSIATADNLKSRVTIHQNPV